jgi:hypothetical protein
VAKNGLVELTTLFEHANRVLVKYSAAVNAGVALGIATGGITAAEGAAILAALASMQSALSAIKKLTGY